MTSDTRSDNDAATVAMAGPDQARELVGFINYIQPHIPWDETHLRWQFFDAPAGLARLYTIRVDGQIAALYCACPKHLTVDGESHTAFMVQDVMTDPAYRGRGFLHRLAKACGDDLTANGEIGYTFPNKLSEGSFRRTGWQELTPVPWRACAPIRLDRDGASRVSELDGPFPSTVDAVWENAGLRCGVARTAAFLNWRYARPATVYRRFLIDAGAGVLVLKTYQGDDVRLVHICELLVREAARESLPDVLAFCHDYARREGADRLTAWLPEGHPYAGTFDAFGLVREHSSDRYAFVWPRGEDDPVRDPSNWHLTQGDSDVY
jgi:GNAT superfamily N-acetyltransferase